MPSHYEQKPFLSNFKTKQQLRSFEKFLEKVMKEPLIRWRRVAGGQGCTTRDGCKRAQLNKFMSDCQKPNHLYDDVEIHHIVQNVQSSFCHGYSSTHQLLRLALNQSQEGNGKWFMAGIGQKYIFSLITGQDLVMNLLYSLVSGGRPRNQRRLFTRKVPTIGRLDIWTIHVRTDETMINPWNLQLSLEEITLKFTYLGCIKTF